MIVYLVPMLGDRVGDRLFIVTSRGPSGWDAFQVWPNPAEPAMWIVDDEPTFIRRDRVEAGGFQEVGFVNRVTLSITDPSAMRRASEVNG